MKFNVTLPVTRVGRQSSIPYKKTFALPAGLKSLTDINASNVFHAYHGHLIPSYLNHR